MSSRWPIFIISLPDAEERRSSLVKALEIAGFCYEIFHAVDARKGVPPQYNEMVDVAGMKARFGRLMSAPEIGCALSHILVYKEIIKRQLPGALILEDDTVWSDAATSLLGALEPGKIDFLQLDYGWADIWRFIPRRRSGVTEVTFKRLAKNAGLASSYLVSKRGVDYLAGKSCPISFPADWPCDLRILKPMVTVPRVCHQVSCSPEYSYLEGGRRKLKDCVIKPNGSPSLSSVWQKGQSTRNPRPRMPYPLYRLLIKRVRAYDRFTHE